MKIAFYLNLQGSGHCRRFEAIAPHLPANAQLAVVGMNREPPIAPIDRPIERFSVPGFSPPAENAFMQQQTSHDYHGFLVNYGGNTAFAAAMVSFLNRWQPDLLVVDVGLEASILARMCGIPTVYIRQHGHRWDKGHCLAYEWACSLWAPFAAEMEEAECPNWIREKTFYSGGLCRFSGKKISDTVPVSYTRSNPNVLVMAGFGGTNISLQKIATAAAATPHWQWHILGDYLPTEGVCCHGIVEDVWPYLCHADLVIANAGHNTTMEIAAAGAACIFIPAERPFAEQRCKAEILDAMGLGVVISTWPDPSEWPELWDKTKSLELSSWKLFQDAQASRRAADYIAHIAKHCTKPS